MSLWDLDPHGFQDTSVFNGSQLLLSTGINIRSKCHGLKLFLDIYVRFSVCYFSVFPLFDIVIRCG